VTTASLNSGKSKSCGCLIKEIRKRKSTNTFDLNGKYGVGYTSWYIKKNGYLDTVDSNNKHMLMHRLIMDVLDCPEIQVDHINNNKLDNRKENLRLCTFQQNMFNRGIKKNNSSGITGVVWDKEKNKWCAQIRYNNKNIFLGYFDDINEAKNARQEAEIRYFGKFRYQGSDNIEIQ